MARRSRIRLAAAVAGGLLLLPLAPVAAAAGAAPLTQFVACSAARADVTSVSVDNLRYGINQAYFWVSATVRLLMKDQSVQEYALRGRADPIARQIAPNGVQPGFSYPGFNCTVRYPMIKSVDNCHGRRGERTCDIGIEIFGNPLSYVFSLTAELVKMREAALR